MLTFAFAMLLTLAPQQAGTEKRPACVSFDIDGDVFRGTGDCILEYQDMRFEAPWITYNHSTGEVMAGDHIHFTRGKENIEGSHLTLNIRTKAGTIWDATGIVEPGFHVVAKVAERFEDSSWEFHNATITACESLKPCWTIAQARAFFRPGEWVRGRNSVFRFHGLPIFYLPYVEAPSEAKDRQTGFLIPSISKSNIKGWGIHDEFYYVINRSADASVVGEYYSQAGAAVQFNFRAKPTQTGYISVSSFFAKDLENPDIRERDQYGRSLRMLAYSNFGQYTRGVVDLETESSVSFRQFWGDSFSAIASPINRSVGFLTTNRPNLSYSFLYSRSEFLQSNPSTALRKIPTFEMSLPSYELPTPVPLYFRFEGSATGLSRRDEQIPNPHLGGRFDFHPSLEMPLFRGNAFELSHEFGIRDTEYLHSLRPDADETSLNRFTLEYSARLAGPEFTKDYGKWHHSIRPTAEYRYVTGVDDFHKPLIVDDVDLDANTSELEYGITNRLIGSREILNWRVAQVAYFRPTFGGAIVPGTRNVFNPLLGLTGYSFADGPRDFSPIVSKLKLSPGPIYSVELQSDYDTQLHRMRSTGLITDIRKGMWGSSTSYVFNATTTLQESSNQIHESLSYGNGLNRGFSFGASFAYSVQQDLLQGAVFRVGYNTECYGLSAEFTTYNLGSRQEHKVRIALSLKNIGTFGTMRPQDRVF
jgi:LPS-assembly protein